MSDTKQRIMDLARPTVQALGYSGLSFRELAKAVGIKSASIHHHFPTKGDLGAALAQRYTADFAEYLDGLLVGSPNQEQCLAKYADVFRNTLLNENRMCMAGIMAAEHEELPTEVRAEVIKYTEMNVRWLVRALSLGKKKGSDERRGGRASGACGVRRDSRSPTRGAGPWKRGRL